jgi:hypothetical protein
MAALCRRQEIQRRGRPKSSFKQEEPRATPEDSKENKQDIFPLVYKPTQYIFCLGKEGLSYLQRTYKYRRPNKMMNEVAKYLRKYAPDNEIPYPYLLYRINILVLPSIKVFKNYTTMVYKITLRV